ncbi:MAG: hypothetical protein HC893_16900 [Chloroflexaceae bacterium]|nr:hypothetical protein [Chloroflexaceae bacterium]
MHDHHILASSRFTWRLGPGAYRAEEGGYFATIAYSNDTTASVSTYRAVISYQHQKGSMRAESFNNLEDAVEWCEKQIPFLQLPPLGLYTFGRQEADEIDHENIWDFLRRLGVQVA